jgi:Tfp pilus assembly major pilin PilA
MEITMKSTRKQQTGASFFSVMIILIVAGFLFSMAFKLYPSYLDFNTIDSVLTQVSTDRDELKKGVTGIKLDLSKKFRINQVKLPYPDALVITKEKGVIYFTLDYEIRVPMFYNVDAMVKFEKQYEAIAP